MDLTQHMILTMIGIIMLCVGGNWLVNASVFLSQKLKINKLIIGITIVAIGTSIPELATSFAAIGIHDNLILGNIIGSNIANIGLVMGITLSISISVLPTSELKKQLFVMIFVSIIYFILITDDEISGYDGIVLLIIMGMFFIITYFDIKKDRQLQDDIGNIDQTLQFKSILLMPFGILLLYVGSLLTVDNVVISAKLFGLSERIVGVSIVAIGTSLPELITSTLAIRKKYSDIGVGNIIGSNIYNILFILGISSILIPIQANLYVIYYDSIIMILFSCLFAILIIKTNKISKVIGFCFIILYTVYLLFSFLID
ncbi:MAG: calcium/sodium antiporter [Nitrosopumilaceae archaeon]|nr:calcium/sodium antiporter [Nitrosopumilaceae archaeon]